MRRRGVRGGMGLRPSFKTGMRETRLLYTVAQYVHCMKRPGRGGVRLKWNPHSTNKTAFPARVSTCLEEKASLTEAREEWFSRAPGQRVGKS